MERVQQLPMVNQRFEQVFHKDHRDCQCEMPMISRKWNDALGTFVAVRLCCMAKLLDDIAEKLGIESRRLYEVFDFDPKWVWDCDAMIEAIDPITEEKCKQPHGPPPAWLRQRLEAKGIPILNLPTE